MIKKVSFLETSVNCVDYNGDVHNVAEGGIINKINELVDAVNQLTLCEQARTCHELIHKNEEPVDPFAEQRKWIGKLCKFWDDEYDLKTAGVLEEITTIEEFHYTKKGTRTVWKHCEPVKPDDPIIYKGE